MSVGALDSLASTVSYCAPYILHIWYFSSVLPWYSIGPSKVSLVDINLRGQRSITLPNIRGPHVTQLSIAVRGNELGVKGHIAVF